MDLAQAGRERMGWACSAFGPCCPPALPVVGYYGFNHSPGAVSGEASFSQDSVPEKPFSQAEGTLLYL